MNTFLAKYKDLALKVIYYTKKRQLGTKIFFATSKFQDVLQYFEQNLKDSQTYLKPCYLLNGKQIFPSDVLLYFCTVDPNLRLVEEDLFLEVEEFENLDDASEPIYEKLLTPSINPFKIYILNPKDGVLQLIDYPKEQVVQNGLDNLNENFACCNSTDSLYISYGKNLWIISHNDYQIEKKEMPLFKEKHSMAYILSNNTVFFAGGSEDCFFYDINSKEFILWGKQNGVSERPALIQFGDFLYSFNSFSQSGIYFEKTKLTNPAKKWDKIVPQSGDQESGFFYNKSYGVSKCSGGNVLFAGGINNQLRTFKYNLKSNILFINPSKDESILFTERNFYKIDHNFNIAIPKDLEKDHVIAIINKNSKTLNLLPIEQIGINSRNNLLQLDSPANRIPGNLIIQCRYMSIKDYDNFLKSKEQKNNKINSGAEKKELRPRLGNRFNGDRFRYNYRGKTPALERINEKRDEEEDEDDSRKEPHSSSNKKKRRSFDLGMKLDDFGSFNFSKKKLEDEDDKNENENKNDHEDKDKNEDKANQNITNVNNNNNTNENQNKEPIDNKLGKSQNPENENKENVVQKDVKENIVQKEIKENPEQDINKEPIQSKNEDSLKQKKIEEIITQKESKEIIDNKENRENNLNANLRLRNNKRNENIDINVDYNDAYINETNEKDNLKSEEMSEKKKKSDEIEFKPQISENMKKPKNEIRKEEENKESNNEPISNKGTKKKIKHKKIDLNMVKKEEKINNDFNSSNATTPPSSLNDINNVPKNNNINLKINLQEEKSNKKNKKDINYTNNNYSNYNNVNIKATNKGMIVNNKNKDNICININLMKKVETEENIKEPQTPDGIKCKPKQINYNITNNNNKRNNQKNIQYKKVSTPTYNNMNYSTNNNMNIKANINTPKSNELKRVDSSSKNNKLQNSKNYQQNPKENNSILKSNTNFVPYSSPHKLQKYQSNPFVDNSKYQNLGEKNSYQFRDENEQNQNQNQNKNQNISSRAAKAVKSQKRKERKSCNYNTMTSMTMIDNQQVMSNDMIKCNNIKKSSYKTSTHKQAKGQRILSLENYNSVKSSVENNEGGVVYLSEMSKNVRINKKDLTPDSNRITFNKSDLNKKMSNYTDMYIKHNNMKLNQQYNGKRQNYINNINVSSNSSNISTNNSMRIYKTGAGNILKSQSNTSSEKLIKGGNTVINDECFKASDGKRYVMARNVKRIRREEELGVPKGNEDKKKICATNDSNRDHYDSVNNNIK